MAGENNLHSHSGSDGFWFVLEGSVNWYGDGDEFIAKLDKHDGILVPRGTPYWFEQTGDIPSRAPARRSQGSIDSRRAQQHSRACEGTGTGAANRVTMDKLRLSSGRSLRPVAS